MFLKAGEVPTAPRAGKKLKLSSSSVPADDVLDFGRTPIARPPLPVVDALGLQR